MVDAEAGWLQQIPDVPVRIGIGSDGKHRVEGRRSAPKINVVLPHRRRAIVILEQDVGTPVVGIPAAADVAQADDVPGGAGIDVDEACADNMDAPRVAWGWEKGVVA